MIKVNLLKDRAVGEDADVSQGVVFERKSSSLKTQKESLVKLFYLSVFTIFLAGYEYYNIDKLNQEKAQRSRRMKKVETEFNKVKSFSARSQVYQKEIQEIKTKVRVLKSLATHRLREIRSLDILQSLVPSKLWLSSLEYEEDSLLLEGSVLDDIVLNQFIDRLEKSGLFRNVILMRFSESAAGRTQGIKDFLLRTQMESSYEY